VENDRIPPRDEDPGDWFDSLTPFEEFLFNEGINPRATPITTTTAASTPERTPDPAPDPARRLSLKEAADRLGVSKKTVGRLVRERRLRCIHVGRRLTFRQDDLTSFKGAPSRRPGGAR